MLYLKSDNWVLGCRHSASSGKKPHLCFSETGADLGFAVEPDSLQIVEIINGDKVVSRFGHEVVLADVNGDE